MAHVISSATAISHAEAHPMNALSPVNRPLVRQPYRFPHMTLPHPPAPPATLAVFATYFATFAASCCSKRPPSPMNPRIALIQNEKAAQTAMCTIPVNITPSVASSPPCPSPSSVSSVVVLVSAWHGRLTCDLPGVYSTGAIWDRLPNLSRAAARTRSRARHDDRHRPPRQQH